MLVSSSRARVVIWLIAVALPRFAPASIDKGAFHIHMDSDPTTLNPITSSDAYAADVQAFVYSSLLNRDDDTYEWVPQVAEKWEISKDGKTFTFKLRPGVKWSDGKPLTAEDVKYSFDVYFETGRFNAPHVRVYLEGLKEVKVVDPTTVQFIAKETYFKNFEIAATLTLLPKHFYGTGDANDPKFNKTLVGSGPYVLSEWVKGQRIVLTKNTTFFGTDLPYFKDRYKFDKILFKPVKEETVALEMTKKGDLDFMGLTPEQYVLQTKGAEWGTKVHAVKTQNSSAGNFGYGFIGWNLKNPLFKEREARLAMSQLINRDFMIEKFRFNLSEKATGPFGNKNDASSTTVKPIEFDPKGAVATLGKIGWKMGPKGLARTIEGKERLFEFTLLSANQDFEKYLTVIKEDMKKVGITMNIKILEWNSFVKLIDERNFDAVSLAWTASLDPDPKQIWHSTSIPAPGHNFVSYANPEVDKLIDEARITMDRGKRMSLLRKVHELIAADQPYSFFFNRKFSLYANTARIQKPKDTFKYSIGFETWWAAKD